MTGGRERVIVKLLIGHDSEQLDKPNSEEHTFRWTCFVRPANSATKFVDRNFINKVKFKLHESYKEPVRTIRDPPFEVTETAYGSFPIQLEIYFNYPGAKAKKLPYDMLLQLTKKGHDQQEVILEVQDGTPAFAEMAKMYGNKRKRSGGADEGTSKEMIPPAKIAKAEDVRSPRDQPLLPSSSSSSKLPNQRKDEDRFSRELKMKEQERKEREKKRERERQREKDKKKEKEKGKDKEKEKQRDEKEIEEKRPPKEEAKPKTSPDIEKLRKESPPTALKKASPPTFMRKNSPSVSNLKKPSSPTVFRRDSPSTFISKSRNSPATAVSPPIMRLAPPKPIKHAPSKTDERKLLTSESDLSSPCTSYGSLTPRTPLSVPNPGSHMTLNEMQRRISNLTDEEQIFRVAALLLALPGTNISPSKPALSFDIDLSTVDPVMISRLCDALV